MFTSLQNSFESNEPSVCVVDIFLDVIESGDFFSELGVVNVELCDFIRETIYLMNQSREYEPGEGHD